MEWWVTIANGNPVGPVSTEQLLQGIGAAEVPKDAFVCEIGGTAWQMIGSVPEFRDAFARHPNRSRLEPATMLESFEAPTASLSVAALQRFGDETERTIVEPPPFSPSEPPPGAIDEDDDQRPTVQVRRSPE